MKLNLFNFYKPYLKGKPYVCKRTPPKNCQDFLQVGVAMVLSLIKAKLEDHKTQQEDFITKATARLNELLTPEVKVDFRNELQRFLPTEIVKQTVHNESFWVYLIDEISKVTKDAIDKLLGKKESGFLM